ncbi:MAG: thioredoxin family protein [bacterium]|nr:thioredoxin family protein [bacterium]
MKIIKFGALWCPGCLVMKSRWDKVKKEIPNLDIIEYDYDMDQEMVSLYKIGRKLPVVIILDKDNKERLRLIGEQSVKKIIEIIRNEE